MYSHLEVVKEVVGPKNTVRLLYDAEIKRWKVVSERKGVSYSATSHRDEDEANRAFTKRVVLTNR